MRNLIISLLILLSPYLAFGIVQSSGAGGGAGSDTTAIHVDTADEFSGAALEGSPNNSDRILIESNGNSLEKRYITIGTLPAGTGITSFDVSANAGSPQTITSGNVITFTGENGIQTTANATDTITIGLTSAYKTNIDANTTHRTSSGSDHSFIDQDVTSGISPTFTGTNITGIPAVNSEFSEVGTATYDDLQDWFNSQSSGIFTGATVTDNADGTIGVTAGTGKISSGSTAMSIHKMFNFAASSSMTLTDEETNYVYVDYNSGSPTLAVTLDPLTLDQRSQFVACIAAKSGTDLHILNAGQKLENFQNKVYLRQFKIKPVEKAQSGAVVSETGTLQLDVTAGTFFFASNSISTSAKDTSGTDTFKYVYRDGGGGYTVVDSVTTINNLLYDDGSGTLAELTPARYGVHWVFMVLDDTTQGEIHVIYGRGDYTLAQAQAASIPTDLPNETQELGSPLAKIIIQKSASSFYSILKINGDGISFSVASDHGALAGLPDDDHTQYSLVSGARAFTGAISGTRASFSSTVTGNKLTDGTTTISSGVVTANKLTDGTISITGGNLTGATGVTATNLTGTLQTASQTNINAVGTIGTGVWQGTAVADTYVANDLTLAGGTIGTTAITLVNSAGASPTTLALIQYDSTGDYIVVGDGTNTRKFSDITTEYFACSDEDTDLTTGTAKLTFHSPNFDINLTDISASLKVAPVGATLNVDVNDDGTSIFSTVLTVDPSELTSETATDAHVFSSTVVSANSKITIDIDQVGSSTAGDGLKVRWYWRRN